MAPFDAEPLKVSQAVLPRSETMRQKRHRLRKVSGRLLPKERVRNCGCHRHSDMVDIHRSEKGAHFVGVETCGSVWLCPVCAAKISETRREEVAEAINGAKMEGGSSYMLTLTMQHKITDPLDFLKEQIVNGWRKVQNRRAYRSLKAEFGVIGTIRAIEVTHGANGWHPHLHILFVMDGPLLAWDEAHFQNALFDLWQDVLFKSGEFVSLKALDFRDATASDYVTKWGTDRELVKGHQKEGKGRTPWALLDDFSKGDKRAGALFGEYAETFKGTRQLTWSKGLKARYGIGELDDMDAARDGTETDEQLQAPLDDLPEGRIGTLPWNAFDLVVKKGLTADLLDAAHAHGWRGVCELLAVHEIALGDDLDISGIYTPDKFEGSFAWKQPPKGGRPAHPKYYLKWNHKEFMENAAKSND